MVAPAGPQIPSQHDFFSERQFLHQRLQQVRCAEYERLPQQPDQLEYFLFAQLVEGLVVDQPSAFAKLAGLDCQLSFPNIVLSAFAHQLRSSARDAVGKQRWYEKISLQYTGTLGNTVNVKEKDLFTEKMFKSMRNGINHQIPADLVQPVQVFQYQSVVQLSGALVFPEGRQRVGPGGEAGDRQRYDMGILPPV